MQPLSLPLAEFPSFFSTPGLLALAAIGFAVWMLSQFGSFTLVFLQIWNHLRPKGDQYVTRAEFQALTREIEVNRSNSDKHFAELSAKMDGTAATMNSLSNDIMRAVGRLEGRNE